MSQQQMPNPVDLFRRSTAHVKQVLGRVKQGQLNSPTPCSEWNVRTLINHLIGGGELVKGLLSGNPPANIGFDSGNSSYSAETDVRKLAQAYDTVVAEALRTAASPGALDIRIPGPVGEMTGGQFLAASFMDQLVHGWDLARATGQDARLDPALVQVCYDMFVPAMIDHGRAIGVIGPAVPVPDHASLQDKLLGYMGRQP